jgi:hypothetical protein
MKLEKVEMTTLLTGYCTLPDRNDGLTCTSELRQLGELTCYWWSKQSGDQDQQSAGEMEYSSRVAKFTKSKILLYI